MMAVLLAALLGAEVAPEGARQLELAAAPALAFRGHLEWLSAGLGADLREGPVNPANRVLALPQLTAISELRPELRLEYGNQLTALLRPRLALQVERARVGGAWAAERSSASAEWIEAYASWRVDDSLTLSGGRQSFQWGPAELVSPSNRIFHTSGLYRDPLYLVRGKQLARVNVSAGRQWSAVLLAEVAPSGEAPFVADQPFESKAQVKVEYSGEGGDRYLGLTAGAGQRSRAWFGEYGTVPLVAGLTAYLDALHTVGRLAWYPVEDGAGGATFAQRGLEGRRLRTMVLGGLRYGFAGGADARLEYLFDEAGWDRSDLTLASRAAAADPRLVGRYLAPGFELPGRRFAYLSVLLPDLPPGKRTTVQLRSLRSLTDGSGAAFATVSHAATDAVVAFASVAATYGNGLGALSALARSMATAGLIVNW